MIIPFRQLSPEALAGVIEEFVTRDGTEFSESADKAAAVRSALERGELVLVFDPQSESCNLLSPDEAACAAVPLDADEPVVELDSESAFEPDLDG